jgi:hypothetical protein
MAVVRFSSQLITQIKINAANTFAKREADAVATVVPTAEIRDYLLSQGFGPMRDKINALPGEFFEQVTYFTLISFGGVRVNMRFDLLRPVSWPKHIQESHPGMKFRNSGYNNQSVDYTPDLTNAEDMDLQSKFQARQDAINAVSRARIEYIDGVEKVCGAFTTLAPALKAWPPLWDLLPNETKAQHQRINDRKGGSTADLSGVDLDSLTVQSTIAKMTR